MGKDDGGRLVNEHAVCVGADTRRAGVSVFSLRKERQADHQDAGIPGRVKYLPAHVRDAHIRNTNHEKGKASRSSALAGGGPRSFLRHAFDAGARGVCIELQNQAEIETSKRRQDPHAI